MTSLQRGVGLIPSVVATLTKYAKPKVHRKSSQASRFPHCFLDKTVACIAQFVHGQPTELVFNLDEVSISEWEDRKTKTAVITKSMSEQTIHHKINRNVKHV
jgi:hypothetical protein